MSSTATWPKLASPVTPEQQRISVDLPRHRHEVSPGKVGAVESFSHRYVVEHAPKDFLRTLEIGAGFGEHIPHEKLSPEQEHHYHALELRQDMAAQIHERFPNVQVCVGDCQERLEFVTGDFDRVIAIHVLEHLPNLPAAIREMRRLCEPDRGMASVVISCEGGFAYSVARRIGVQRAFESREHINQPREIVRELEACFSVTDSCFFPLGLRSVGLNLCIGLTLKPKPLSEIRNA